MSMSSFHTPSKVLNFIDTRPKDNVVKGAVKLDPNLGEFLASDVLNIQPGTNSTTFATFDKQDQSLSAFIAQLCTQLGLNAGEKVGNNEFVEQFALMFEDRKRFVTESNKQNLHQGFILKLTASPAKYAEYFISQLGSTRPLSLDQLSMFGALCVDAAFANAFHEKEGIQRLSNVIEEAADWHPFIDANGSGSILLGLMHALLHLMQLFPQLIPWAALSAQFVRKIAFFINGQSKLERDESRVLALDMLLVLADTENCDHLWENLKREVPIHSLIRHLDNPDQRVLLGTLALINALYKLADREERIAIVKTLHERPFIAAIGAVLAREFPPLNAGNGNNSTGSTATTSASSNSEQKEQLLEQFVRLQHVRFDEVRALALRTPSDKDIDFLKALEEFTPKTSENVYTSSSYSESTEEEVYTNAPFQQARQQRQAADWLDFRKIVQTTPPGLLAICAILDITRPPQKLQQPEEQTTLFQAWAKLQELDAHFIGRPTLFPQILAKLVDMLLKVLGICDASSVGQRFGLSRQPRFWRLVLKCERPFYELFRVLVELFCRTWRDMNAKPDELGKVYSVVQDQLERAMLENPDTLEQLEHEMLRKRFSYFSMQKIWKREQLEQEELELNSEDIQPLRDHLRPEFERLVLRRRICLLKKGLTFQRILPTKNKENTPSSPSTFSSSPVHSGHVNLSSHHPQYWYWRLDDRERHFNFWDCRLSGGKHTEMVLETQDKLPVAQIRALVHGQELAARLSQQHGMKLHKKGQNVLRCGFCLETQNGQEYFLCAQNEQELSNWLEALNCLCWPEQALQSPGLRAEVDRLLSLEVHIRLMDIPLLKKKPPVPEVPIDLSWIPIPTQ